MSIPDTERLTMLAGMAGPRRIAAELPDGAFREYVTALLAAGIEDVSFWRPTFDVEMDHSYLLVAHDGGVRDAEALAQAWTSGVPVEFAVALLGSDE